MSRHVMDRLGIDTMSRADAVSTFKACCRSAKYYAETRVYDIRRVPTVELPVPISRREKNHKFVLASIPDLDSRFLIPIALREFAVLLRYYSEACVCRAPLRQKWPSHTVAFFDNVIVAARPGFRVNEQPNRTEPRRNTPMKF